MKAVVVERHGPPEVLRLTGEIPAPEPGPGELAVDVAYAGVGFVDGLFREGRFGPPPPFVPGIEVSGHVRALGEGTSGFEVGEPVVAVLNDFGHGPRLGGYAEVAVAHASMTAPAPTGVDLAALAGAAVNGVTAWIALRDLARVRPADRVLVLGASGGLGGTAARLAAVTPAATVVGVVGSERTRAAAPAECTSVVLAADLAAVGEVDVVIDPVGGPARAAAWDLLAPFGRLVVLGNASGDDPPLSGDAAWHGTRVVAGLSLGGVAHLIPDRVAAALTGVATLLARGILAEPPPAVRPLAEAADVHRALAERTAPPKTVLAVR